MVLKLFKSGVFEILHIIGCALFPNFREICYNQVKYYFNNYLTEKIENETCLKFVHSCVHEKHEPDVFFGDFSNSGVCV